MLRKILIASLAGVPLTLSAQSRNADINRLMWENISLRKQVDSLTHVVSSLGGDTVTDTWAHLTIIDFNEELYGLENAILDGNYDPELLLELKRLTPNFNLSWHPCLRQYVEQYTTGTHKKAMSSIIGRYNKYYPEFKRIFSQYGIPEEVIPLCIVESAVTAKAESKAGAVGCWQIMKETASGYGLIVDGLVDERMDIRRSTVVAAKYLANAYKTYHRWDLAVLSYNCGQGNVNKAIIRSGNSRELWKIYDHLPEETKGYLPSLVAANYVLANSERLGIKAAVLPAKRLSVYVTKEYTDIYRLATLCGVDHTELKNNNPQFLSDSIPAGCAVWLPAEAIKNLK